MFPEILKDRIVLLDGGMGTVLQQKGLQPGGMPELLNLTDPGLIESVHRDYINAGSRVIYTNTFGANPRKLAKTGHSAEEVISAAVSAARSASAGTDTLVALDIGPLGELLEPMGTLSFEDAYDAFKEMAIAGAASGADLAVIETMTDLYEAKAALLAVKENTDLPVFVTMSFEQNGRTFTGCGIQAMARTLEGLGADAIGINCSLGPDLLAPLIAELCTCTTLPVIAKPNAGLPDPATGEYDMRPEDFARALAPCAEYGVTLFGGCCGTSPEYIKLLSEALKGKEPAPRSFDAASFVCSAVDPCRIDGVRVIGERVNPTGKKRFQQALLDQDLDYILDVAVEQEDAGADILDVNVGFPGVDEPDMLARVVKKIQSAVSLPLQLDSSNAKALEAGLRVYNGKAVVNSVNGDPDVLARVLPVVKKYGAAVVGLCLDRNGIPKTAEERIAIAERILDAAVSYGIPREDVWIDCLTLTVSAEQDQAVQTLKALRYVREELGLQTVLGVSNISFGLPNRPLINQNFLIQALGAGLTVPIINPNLKEMMDAVAAFRVLSGEDEGSRAYIERFADTGSAQNAAISGKTENMSIEDAVIRGLPAEAGKLAKDALLKESELELVEHHLIPALDRVGEAYEAGKAFLPQLLSAAKAAQAVFEVIRTSIAEKGGEQVKKGRFVIATARGDIHDIGKNIVKTVMENYGYEAIDLGRDVPPELILETVKRENIGLVGLSALMTTTLPAMEETIKLLHTMEKPPVIFVGGAVVTPEYARKMGADHYAKDARESVEIARKVFGE
ncbi:MAG: homocysteine S-methyltransferase family protein [Firmicutes bacterium]|nr:homocysteine S-methyltransferase family protein [Bacillota bacterium]